MAFKRLSTPGAVIRLPLEAMRIGPEHEHIVGMVNIGHGDEEEVPKHETSCEVAGQLVGRSG